MYLGKTDACREVRILTLVHILTAAILIFFSKLIQYITSFDFVRKVTLL